MDPSKSAPAVAPYIVLPNQGRANDEDDGVLVFRCCVPKDCGVRRKSALHVAQQRIVGVSKAVSVSQLDSASLRSTRTVRAGGHGSAEVEYELTDWRFTHQPLRALAAGAQTNQAAIEAARPQQSRETARGVTGTRRQRRDVLQQLAIVEGSSVLELPAFVRSPAVTSARRASGRTKVVRARSEARVSRV